MGDARAMTSAGQGRKRSTSDVSDDPEAKRVRLEIAGAAATARARTSMQRALEMADTLVRLSLERSSEPVSALPLGETYRQAYPVSLESWLAENEANQKKRVPEPGLLFLKPRRTIDCIACPGIYLVVEGAVPNEHTHLSVLPSPPGTQLADDADVDTITSRFVEARRKHGQLPSYGSTTAAAEFAVSNRITIAVYGSTKAEWTPTMGVPLEGELSRDAPYTHGSPILRLCCSVQRLQLPKLTKALVVENAVWCDEEQQGPFMKQLERKLEREVQAWRGYQRTKHVATEDTSDNANPDSLRELFRGANEDYGSWFWGDGNSRVEELTRKQLDGALGMIARRNVLQMVQRQLMVVAYLDHMDFVQLAWNIRQPGDSEVIDTGQIFYPGVAAGILGAVDGKLQHSLPERFHEEPYRLRNAWVFTNSNFAAQVFYTTAMFHGVHRDFHYDRSEPTDPGSLLSHDYLVYAHGQLRKVRGTALFKRSGSGANSVPLLDIVDAFGVIISAEHIERMASIPQLEGGTEGIASLTKIQVNLCENILRAVTAPTPQGRATEIRITLRNTCGIYVAGNGRAPKQPMDPNCEWKKVAVINWKVEDAAYTLHAYGHNNIFLFGNPDAAGGIESEEEDEEDKRRIGRKTLIIEAVFVSPEYRQRGFFSQLMAVAFMVASKRGFNVAYNVWRGENVLRSLRTLPYIQPSEALWLRTLFPVIEEATGRLTTSDHVREWIETLNTVLRRALDGAQSCAMVAERLEADMDGDISDRRYDATYGLAEQGDFVRVIAHILFLHNLGVLKVTRSKNISHEHGKYKGVVVLVSGDTIRACIGAIMPAATSALASAAATSVTAMCTSCGVRAALYQSPQQHLCNDHGCRTGAAMTQILATHALEQWM